MLVANGDLGLARCTKHVVRAPLLDENVAHRARHRVAAIQARGRNPVFLADDDTGIALVTPRALEVLHREEAATLTALFVSLGLNAVA